MKTKPPLEDLNHRRQQATLLKTDHLTPRPCYLSWRQLVYSQVQNKPRGGGGCIFFRDFCRPPHLIFNPCLLFSDSTREDNKMFKAYPIFVSAFLYFVPVFWFWEALGHIAYYSASQPPPPPYHFLLFASSFYFDHLLIVFSKMLDWAPPRINSLYPAETLANYFQPCTQRSQFGFVAGHLWTASKCVRTARAAQQIIIPREEIN